MDPRWTLILLAEALGCGSPAPAARVQPAKGVTIDVVESRNVPPSVVQARLMPVAEQMHRCTTGPTGILVLRVTGRGRQIDVAPTPGLGLDEKTRACALDLLSTFELTDTGSNAGGPAVPPTAFTSIVTLAW